MTPPVVERIPVVDTDAHVCEPPDLWMSRLPKKWHDIAPQVVQMPTGPGGAAEDVWTIGGKPIIGAWQLAVAGWKELYPLHPLTQDQAPPAAWDPVERLKVMDDHGVSVQVLYSNILAFYSLALRDVGDSAFQLACVQAYNDFLSDFAAADPDRLVPITNIPFWDIDQTVAEIERCAALGHRGILFMNSPEKAGLPVLRDPHWDPMFSTAEALGMSINFHAASSAIDPQMAAALAPGSGAVQDTADMVKQITLGGFLANATAIVEVIVSGMCARYPKLDFVSVESGFGFLPFVLEALDWQWLNNGAKAAYPDRLMPSEYFRRQVYSTFWFEQESFKRLVDLYPDNVMFETDFPHPTCLAPGPASYTDSARVVLEDLADVDETILRKVLHDNAARVYRLGQ